MEIMNKHSALLRIALRLNAVFSLITGMIAFVNTEFIRVLLGIESGRELKFIGLSLIVFALSLSLISIQKKLHPKIVSIIIFLDWSWVLGSGILLVLNPFCFSFHGLFGISIVAIIVSSFAIIQRIGLRKMNNEGMWVYLKHIYISY